MNHHANMVSSLHVLLIFILGLGLASSYHHQQDPMQSILTELHQVKHALRNAELQLAHQQAAFNSYREKPEPRRSSPSEQHKAQQPTTAPPSSTPCASCSLLKTISVFGLISAFVLYRGCASSRVCSPGPSILCRVARTTSFAIVSILSITTFWHLLFVFAELLTALVFVVLPIILPSILMFSPLLWFSSLSRCDPRQQPVPRGDVLPVTPLAIGSRGPGVTQLQHCLIALGYMEPSAICYYVGYFGPRTQQAIAKVQTVMKLEPTGRYETAVMHQLEIDLATAESASHSIHPTRVGIVI
jgi:hypothetical protein